MKTAFHFFSILMVFILGFSSLGAGLAVASNGVGTAPIRLKSAVFTPGQSELTSIPSGLAVASYAANQRGYYIVQFNGPILENWKTQLVGLGADLLEYIPDFAFKVRMNPAQAAQVEQLSSVSWVGLFHPAYKLSPDLKREGVNLFRVHVEQGADAGLTAAAVSTSGAQLLRFDGGYLLVAADSAQVNAIANVLDVAWVENFYFQEKHNEYGAGVIMGANIANANGYDGSGQIVAVADTGLGGGTAATAHPGIDASRIVAIQNFTTSNARLCYRVKADGAQDVDSGHGTHTAVSVVGAGNGGVGTGTAPAAGLVFQAVEEYLDIYGACTSPSTPDGYYLIGLPDDLHTLYQQAYNVGARIHSNSWGSSVAGDYTLDSANTDDFMWDNPDMLITFSAGNSGIDINADGIIDNDSIGSPATAKNVLTVGASENARADNFPCDSSLSYNNCATQNGVNSIFTYGTAWPSDYPANPIASDPSAGNAAQMAAFSSRGPTDDGRIKPDVVAPGTWVLSGYSDLYQQGYDASTNPQNGLFQYDGWGFPLNSQYKYMGGTSMSNPLAAGAAAVVRDFYATLHGHNASAALVKATLINSAVDLLDENNDGANDNDFPIPNVHEGWGRVDLAAATDGIADFADVSPGLATNDAMGYSVTVSSAGPLKISLVWTDFASSEAAATNLVNDLDLTVTGPDGTVYSGNVFSGGWSQVGGVADRINNVENVYIQSAQTGVWYVQIKGYNIPQGPQPFALVVDGGTLPVADFAPTVTITNPTSGSTVSGTLNITANASDDNGVTQVEFFIDNVSIGVDTTAPYQVSWDTTTVTDGQHSVSVVATDTIGQIGSASVSVTVQNGSVVEIHVGDLDGSAAVVRKNWNATVTITVHNASEGLSSGITVTGDWSGGTTGTSSCVTVNGQCSVTSSNISSKKTSVTFTITGLSAAGYTYNSGANHDEVDTDQSDGTSITVLQP